MEDEKNIKKRKEYLKNKIFLLSFETIFIFGIPAFLGLYIGKKIDNFFGTGKTITIAVLICAFILSWVFLIVKYKSLSKQLSGIKENE